MTHVKCSNYKIIFEKPLGTNQSVPLCINNLQLIILTTLQV